ncbi:MAG: PfkB family carbohydrate kinase [Opitutus sp.]
MKDAPHIFTLTGNLLAERTLEFASWAPGKTHRATGESFQVGGKGINVSKMLNRLRVKNTALCFTGGATGAECSCWLQSRGFMFQDFSTDQRTRTGTVIRSGNQPETTFLGPDVTPSPTAVAECASFLNAQPDGQVLAVCGSFPAWAESHVDVLRSALSAWVKRGILVADTYGAPLDWFARQPLALAKMNAVEFRGLGGDDKPVMDTLASFAPQSPVARWVISDGPGVVITCEQPSFVPALATPPRVTEVSATGSGDVLLASLLEGLFIHRVPLSQALDTAMNLAAANAAHPGVADFPLPRELTS